MKRNPPWKFLFFFLGDQKCVSGVKDPLPPPFSFFFLFWGETMGAIDLFFPFVLRFFPVLFLFFFWFLFWQLAASDIQTNSKCVSSWAFSAILRGPAVEVSKNYIFSAEFAILKLFLFLPNFLVFFFQEKDGCPFHIFVVWFVLETGRRKEETEKEKDPCLLIPEKTFFPFSLDCCPWWFAKVQHDDTYRKRQVFFPLSIFWVEETIGWSSQSASKQSQGLTHYFPHNFLWKIRQKYFFFFFMANTSNTLYFSQTLNLEFGESWTGKKTNKGRK